MSRLLSLYQGPWNQRTARHLLNRAGFGVPFERVQSLATMTMGAAVDSFIEYEKVSDNFVPPALLSTEEYDALRREAGQITDPEERQRELNKLNRETRRFVEELRSDWLQQMQGTTRPLQEKMTLFWHGHFVAAFPKVRMASQLVELNQVMRASATGNYKELVFEVGATPAMLIYLDNRENRKGHPNENWSRELMELFTLGIGHYSEADISEAARAFSGYGVRNGKFFFNARQHDDGEKVFLGRRGTFDGRDIINIIFEQPEASHFIVRKLWDFFVYENPEEEIVEGLAATLRENQFELKPVLRQLFSSQAFYSQKAIGTQIKSPVMFVLGMLDHLAIERPMGVVANQIMRSLGQNLFSAPNVRGWQGNRHWISTNTLTIRYNVPGNILGGRILDLPRERPNDDVVPMMGVAMDQDEESPGERRRNQLGQMLAISKFGRQTIGKSCEEVVDMLIARTHSRPLSAQQRAVLIGVLANGGSASTKVNAATLRNHFAPCLRLVLSTAEYQLC